MLRKCINLLNTFALLRRATEAADYTIYIATQLATRYRIFQSVYIFIGNIPLYLRIFFAIKQ